MRNFVKVLLVGTMLVSFGGGVLAADSGYSWRMSPKDDGNFYNVAITENGKKNGVKFVYFDDQGWEVNSNGQRTGRVVRQDSGIYFLGDAKTGGNAEALYTSTSTRRQFVTNMGNIPVSQGVADGTIVRDYDSMWSSPSYEKRPQGGWADRGSNIGLIYDSPKDSSASYFKSSLGHYDHTDVAPRADATPTSPTSQPATPPATSSGTAGSNSGLGRYQVIIERDPFGTGTPPSAPATSSGTAVSGGGTQFSEGSRADFISNGAGAPASPTTPAVQPGSPTGSADSAPASSPSPTGPHNGSSIPDMGADFDPYKPSDPYESYTNGDDALNAQRNGLLGSGGPATSPDNAYNPSLTDADGTTHSPVPAGMKGGTPEHSVAVQDAAEDAGLKAPTPETNTSEAPASNVMEVHAFNPIELILKLLASHTHGDHLFLRDDINIKAGDIGDAVAPVESSALDTNKGMGVGSKTIGGAVEYFKALLSAAVVDLGLLSEKVEFEEPETPITIISNAVLSQVAGSGSGVGGGAPAPSGGKTTENGDENEKDDKGETDNALTEAERKVIEGRRAQLLRQYVNAGIQISEGMNAISHDFPDRAAAFGAVLEKKMDASALPSDAMAGLPPEMQESAKEMMANQSNVQSEPQAFGLAQDVGRYVLFETLRGVALSSTQMGVQATRLLFEQEVLNEKTE